MPVSTTSGTESSRAGAQAPSITVLDQRGGGLGLALGRLEHQLVMHLEQHPRLEPGLRERAGHAAHGALDDVGGGALQRRVDRLALGAGAARRVAGP